MSVRRWTTTAFVITGALAPALHSQPTVSARNTYERMIVVVPMTGAGTADSPRKPLYAPERPTTGERPTGEGIIAYSCEVSDDGNFALCEFVARNRRAFQALLADTRTDIKRFEKGRTDRAEIQRELRRFKANIDLDQFGVNLP